METIGQIRRRGLRDGESISGLARSLQLSGNTVLELHRFRSGQVLMLGGPLFESHGGFPAEG